MNAQDYRAAGFPLSNLIDQAAITRAEDDVRRAYLVPLVGQTAADDETNSVVRAAVMGLAFLLLAQRQTAATRVGGKQKDTPESRTPSRSEITSEHAANCHALLQSVRALDGANAQAKITDICGIYFRSNFIKL